MSSTFPLILGINPNQSTADNAALDPFAGVTVTDGGGGETETVTVVLDNGANGTLGDAGGGSVSGTTYTVSGTAAQVTAGLDALAFTPADHQVAPGSSVTSHFLLTVTSSTNEAASLDLPVNTVAAEDTPVISGGSANQPVTDHATVAPFSALSVTDPDTKAETAVVTIANGVNRGDFTPAAESAGWVRTVSGTDIVYTQTFAQASDIGATVQAATRALVFLPRAHAITPGSTEQTDFTVVVTDPAGHSAANDQIISTVTTAIDDAPTITGAVAVQTLDDNGASTLFGFVSVNEIDPGKTESVTVTLSDAADGTLGGLVAGSYNADQGVYTVVGSAAAVTSALDRLVFTPTQHQVAPGSTVATSFTIAVNDGHGGIATDATTTAVVTAIDTPPVIAGTIANQAITDHQTIAPFAALALTDAEPKAATATVTITNGVDRGSFTAASAAGWAVTTSGTDLVYTKHFGATQNTGAMVQTSVRALVFQPREYAIAPGTSESTGFALSVSELGGGSASDSATSVVTTAADDSPTIAGAAANQAITDAIVARPFSAVTITDLDANKIETVTITPSTASNGALGNLGQFAEAAGVLTISGTASDVTAAIDALTFTPVDHEVAPGGAITTGFTIVVSDNVALTATDATTSVVATAADTSPVLSGMAATIATDDRTAVSPFGGAVLTDIDFGTIDTATVTIGAPGNGGFSMLGAGQYDAATGVYSVSGTAAEVTAALNALVFTPTPHQVPPGAAQTTILSVSIGDGFTGTALGAVSVAATALDDPPTISGAATDQPMTDAATIAPLSGVTIGDVDLGKSETVTLTLQNPDGSAGAANGTLGNPGAGSYDPLAGVYTVTGSAAVVTAALDGLVFTPTAHQVAPGASATTVFALAVDDGQGGMALDHHASVVATAQENAPTIAGTGAAAGITDAATATPFSAVVVGDVDAGKTETLTVALSNAANGLLSGGSGSFAAGVYTVVGSASVVTAALDALVFTPTAHQVAVGAAIETGFTITVDDGVGAPVSDAASSIMVTAAETAPVIGGAAAGQLVNDRNSIAPLSHVTVADPDFGKVETVSVTLDTPGNGTLSDAVAGTYNAATGVFVVAGSASSVTAALDALVFTPTPREVPPGSTVTTRLSVAVDDGHGGTATDATTTVLATASDTPPAISGTLAGQAASDVGGMVPFASVLVADVNRGTTDFVSIVLNDPANGTLGNLAGGTYTAATGTFAVSGDAASVTAAVDGLVFTPTAHQVAPGSAVTTVFAITVDDGHGGVSHAASSVVATAHDDPPSIGGTGAAPGISDAMTASPFASVAIVDGVDPGKVDQVTVTLSDPANGTLASAMGGTFASGIYTVSGTASAVTAAIDGLVFTPTDHQAAVGQSVATSFAIAVSDGHGGSASDSATSITVTAAHDAPVLSGGLADQAVTDHAAIAPFSAVSVTDPDTNVVVATVSIIDGANRGAFAAPGADGWSESVSGTDLIYTRSFGPAADIGGVAQSAIRALVFQPREHVLSPGMSETTQFSVAVDDGSGPVVDPALISTVTTALDDAPTLSGAVAGQITTDRSAIAPFSALTVADPDAGKTETVSVSLDASQGSLVASGAGSYDSATGAFTVSGSAAAVTAALRALTFQPAAHEIVPGQTRTTGFTVAVDDGLGGLASDATTSVVVTGTDTAPTIAGTIAGQAATDETATAPFAAVTIGDVDAGVTDTVTITLDQPRNGTLASPLGGAFADGIYTVSGDAATVTAAVRGLVFTPTAHQAAPGALVTTGFVIGVDDGHGGIATDSLTSVTALATETAPSLTGLAQSQGSAGAAAPFAGVVVGDVDVGKTETVTVTLGQPANGTLANLGAGSFANGVYVVSGSAASVTAALDGLVFTPSAVLGAALPRVVTDFTVAVGDGLGGTAVGATTLTVTPPTASSDPFAAADRQAVAALLSDGAGGQKTVDFTAPGEPLATPSGGQLAGLAIGSESTGQTVVLPAGATIVTEAADGPVTVSGGGSANQTVIATGGDLRYETGSGSGTLLADESAGDVTFLAPQAGAGNFVVATGAGDDFLGASSGNDSLSGGAGRNTFYLGSGQNVVHSDGADTVVAGGGDATVIGGADAGDSGHDLLVFGGAGNLLVSNVAGNETIAGGTGSATLFGGAGQAELFGGHAGHNLMVSGMGDSTLIGGGANDLLFAQGSGNDVLAAGGDNATLQGGSATGNDLYFGGSGHVVIAAGLGNDTIVGGSGQATLFAGAGHDLIYAATGGGDIFAARGNATLVGSAGRETYVFSNGGAGGTDVVFNFHAATDLVALGGFSAAQIAGALQSQTAVNGSAVLSLSDGTHITFVGLSHVAGSNVY